MRIYLRYLLAFFIVVPLAVLTLAQDVPQKGLRDVPNAIRLAPKATTSKETIDVSCWNRHNALTDSRLVRSPVLISPGGLYRAYVEVQAIAFRPKNIGTYVGPLCENTSRLFVASSFDNAFHVVYSQTPDMSSGNSLKIIDWSADGERLVVERDQWVYESDDGAYTDFIVFDPHSASLAVPDLAKILASRFGKGCWSDNSIIGFTRGGQVVIALDPFSNVVALMNGAESCVKHRTLVALGSDHELSVLPRTYKLVHFGRFLDGRL